MTLIQFLADLSPSLYLAGAFHLCNSPVIPPGQATNTGVQVKEHKTYLAKDVLNLATGNSIHCAAIYIRPPRESQKMDRIQLYMSSFSTKLFIDCFLKSFFDAQPIKDNVILFI